jgi:adenylate kinase
MVSEISPDLSGQVAMRVIFIGPPGAGKGTQAKLLCQRNGLEYIGTGDILRYAIKERTTVGERARPYVESGGLVPDEVVNELIAERFRLTDRPARFVTDGYPRTLQQAVSFDRLLEQYSLPLTAVLVMQVDDNEIVQRLMSRKRADDNMETVRSRLLIHHREVEEVVPYYRARGIVHEVHGIGEIEQIYTSIVKILKPTTGK